MSCNISRFRSSFQQAPPSVMIRPEAAEQKPPPARWKALVFGRQAEWELAAVFACLIPGNWLGPRSCVFTRREVMAPCVCRQQQQRLHLPSGGRRFGPVSDHFPRPRDVDVPAPPLSTPAAAAVPKMSSCCSRLRRQNRISFNSGGIAEDFKRNTRFFSFPFLHFPPFHFTRLFYLFKFFFFFESPAGRRDNVGSSTSMRRG